MRLLVLFFLFSLLVRAQNSNVGNDFEQDELQEELDKFTDASDFFFGTLESNFSKGRESKNLSLLFRMILSTQKEFFDTYRLQIDTERFRTLNDSLSIAVYDRFFPIHTYIYEEESDFDYMRGNTLMNIVRDTVVWRIPKSMRCPGPRNPFLEGQFKGSFHILLLNENHKGSPVVEEVVKYLEYWGRYSALEFSINFANQYKEQQLEKICVSKYNRILISLVFWEYLAHCANYDLNTRKFFFETGE